KGFRRSILSASSPPLTVPPNCNPERWDMIFNLCLFLSHTSMTSLSAAKVLMLCSWRKDCCSSVLRINSVSFEQWLEQVITESSQKPTCIDLTSKFGLPLLVFRTTRAMGASLLQYLFINPNSELIRDDDGSVGILDRSLNVKISHSLCAKLLGNNSNPPEVICHSLATQLQNYTFAKESCIATLVITVNGVEAEYLQYLEESTSKPVWSMAPPLRNAGEGVQIVSECITLLDS
ncbi:hypothetical protein KI387_025516, partial [Taxus chinensis]